ncbi:MAG: asparagine synthetase B [Candidatus Cloacimonetes bacterium]|nr:asparagine synthetase B [Candidatus Cloacimonadota bacterium]
MNLFKRVLYPILLLLSIQVSFTNQYFLIEMDESQTDHLRAYGLAYFALEQSHKVQWLLNFKGGSFLMPYTENLLLQATLYGVSGIVIDESTKQQIDAIIEKNNMGKVQLEKAPKIAVYTQKSSDPWDDAVTLVMNYAKIPYDKLWNEEVLAGKLFDYDWLHLHHEDFSGQYGKFYRSFKNAPWYLKKVQLFRKLSKEAGYNSVQTWFGDVAKMVQEYVSKGGFMFAMCSATDSIDVGLASLSLDIVDPRIDGTPISKNIQKRLDFRQTLAFENFTLDLDPNVYEFSTIDVSLYENRFHPEREDFELFEFSAKFDPIPAMLNQNHRHVVKGFLGQTTSFSGKVLKPSVIKLGKTIDKDVYKYIHGRFGKGTFSFYGGHDPEDFSHAVSDPPTDLKLHKNSPGYRLILNNILFPAAKPKPRKT